MHVHFHLNGIHLSTGLSLYILALATVLGLVMGSFLNCFAYRYANGESVLKGHSRCALCGHDLGVLDLVPIFSWLFLKGKCRHCGGKISGTYILSECICALLYVLVLLRFGLSIEAIKFIIFVSLLFAVTFTDIYCQLIPDRLVIIGIINAFVFALFNENIFDSVLSTFVGGISVALPLLLVILIFEKITKKEAMGGGDIKLMFMIGLYFHWSLNLLILIIACFVGLLFALINQTTDDEKENGAFAFGPALSMASVIVMLCGETIVEWYLNLFL